MGITCSPPNSSARSYCSPETLAAARPVVTGPAAAPSAGATSRPARRNANRHGNRSPLPLTNPFGGTADRPLTLYLLPLSPLLPHVVSTLFPADERARALCDRPTTTTVAILLRSTAAPRRLSSRRRRFYDNYYIILPFFFSFFLSMLYIYIYVFLSFFFYAHYNYCIGRLVIASS